MPPSHVVILLATYQGAEHLDVQLDSIAAQSHEDWSLIVSDDGSRDGTQAIVQRFADLHPGRVQLLEGPRAGATANFLSLLERVPQGCLAAFCDQDDQWLPDKLSRAVAALVVHSGPAHYAARTVITDSRLRPLTTSRRFTRPLGLRNALIQACMAGNTSVFNPAAAALLQAGAPHARRAGVISHDWWAYQLMAAFDAALIHDPQPCLLYRQHAGSEVGRNDTLPALAARLRKLMAGEFGSWLRANHAALSPLVPQMPPGNVRTLQQLERMLNCPPPQGLTALRRGGFYRQTRAGTAALVLSVATGALRRGPA